MISKKLAVLLASSTLLTQPVWAQDEIDLGTLVLSPSLSPVEASRTGTSVDVIEDEDAGANDDTVVARLVRLPGVNSSSNGGIGTQAGIQIRGLPQRYVAVRIDGIDVMDPSGPQNAFNFGGLTGATVGRVELLRGSQSALYGSEAIGGVLNITSWRPEKLGFSGKAQVEAGSFKTYSGSFSLGQRSENGFVALSFGRIVTEGISAQTFNTEKDGFKQNTLNLSGEYNVTDQLTFGASIYYRQNDLEYDRSRFSNNATGEIFSEEKGINVYSLFETGRMSHKLSYGYFDIEREYPGSTTRLYRGKRTMLAYLGTADINDQVTLNVGVDYVKEQIDAGATVADENSTSLMAELLYRPSNQFDLSLALRRDDNSDFGGKTTGRIAAAWNPRSDLTFRAVVGTGYRAPSLFERFSAYGVPGLKPETSLSFELGVEKRFDDRGYVKATLFHAEVDDLIQYVSGGSGCASTFGCYNQVSGTSKSKGLELSGEYAITANINTYAAFTYTDARDKNGARFARTPRRNLVLGLNAEFANKWEGYFDVRHVSDVLPTRFAPADHKVGDYTVVGMGVSYDITDTAQMYLRVENLFDEDYETAGGYNQPGRAAYFGLRASF